MADGAIVYDSFRKSSQRFMDDSNIDNMDFHIGDRVLGKQVHKSDKTDYSNRIRIETMDDSCIHPKESMYTRIGEVVRWFDNAFQYVGLLVVSALG
ncbi:MAG: hypothetical protein CMM15_05720 [Rhodospirillaceae bacterium]|nr:hypothetical protein [Rhodospirillaceae bacterium]|tara:strand:- start:1363 stop:1650 length:288 start_codon:yes stop_codon:yes gene_type:complete